MSQEPQIAPTTPVQAPPKEERPAEPPLAPLFRKPWGIFTAAFLLDLAVACIGLSLQFLGVAMGAIPRVLGMLGAFAATGFAVTCIFAGGWSDHIGRKRSAVGGVFLASLMWLLYTRAPSAGWLLVMVPVGGASLGFVWPAVQAWLAERTGPGQRALNRNLGLFNMSWSSGLLLGPVLAGYLWLDSLPALPFVLCSGLGVVIVLILWLTPGGGPGVRRTVATDEDSAPYESPAWAWLMRLAWLGNFASWFAGATIQTMFPKLGLSAEMGLTHRMVGVLIFCYWGALMAMFFLARTTQCWQGKMWPLMVAEAVSLGAMLGAAFYARTASAFALCFAVSGTAAGVTYVNSLYYSINGPSETCARRTGFHEAILGLGALSGGLIGGEVATLLDLRAPYMAVAAVLAVVIVIQALALKRYIITPAADPGDRMAAHDTAAGN